MAGKPVNKKGDWINHHEAASMLGVHPDTVHRWIKEGDKSGNHIIPHYRESYGLGGKSRIKFKRSEIQQAINESTRSHNFGEGMEN